MTESPTSNEKSDALYLEAMERYALLDSDIAAHDSIKQKTLVLSTASADGRVTSRNMTISFFSVDGFVFFTNGDSRKCADLNENPRASLCAYWHPVMQQVSIDGSIEEVDSETAELYWSKRSRDTQLTSWASKQSSELSSRQALLDRYERVKYEYRDKPVPRPPNWRGYRLVPDRIEFWRADWHRPGARTCYEKHDAGWQRTLLFP